MKVLFIVLFAVYLLIYFFLLYLSKKPFKKFTIFALLGLWLFILVKLTGFFTGINLPLNWPSVFLSSFMGPFGVVLLIIIKYFIYPF